MRTAATRHPFLTAALLLTAASSAFGQNTPSRLVQFLHDNIGLGDKQLAAMERGEIVVKALDTRDKRDVAIFAIVTTSVSRDAYTQRLRDFQSWLPRPSRTHYGVFSDPPVAQDVRSLVLDARGIDELKNCQPHACDVKLPATEMQKFREQLAAGGDDQLGAITQYAKQRLVEYIGDYRMHGDSTMTVYDDDKSSVRASDAFAALLAQSPYVYQDVPSLARYLSSYPRVKLDSVAEMIYWSEDVAPRLKPIISATHVVVYTPPEFRDITVMAAKQIYADHYFEAAFELTSVVDRPTAAGDAGSYLLVLRRYRFDNMPSSRFIDLRGRVVDGLRDQLVADLKREKAAAERR